tara:strand:+ start:4991 stop:7192 length:2202 start_codon:yes stop_codon:yes gene_type:complete
MTSSYNQGNLDAKSTYNTGGVNQDADNIDKIAAKGGTGGSKKFSSAELKKLLDEGSTTDLNSTISQALTDQTINGTVVSNKVEYRQDDKGNVYEDIDGGALRGGTTTVKINATVEEGGVNGNEVNEKPFIPAVPTEFPSFQQIKSFENLIKDNPPGEKWQGAIKNIKTQYPDQFKDITSFDSSQIENLSKDSFKQFQKRAEEYKKIDFPDVGPVSLTSGMAVLTANPDKNNFFAETQVQLSNFMDLASKASNFSLDLPGEIKSVANMISSSSQTFIGQIGNSLTDGLIDYAKGGLDGIASSVFAQNLPFNKALSKITSLQTSMVGPIQGMLGSTNCLVNKVSGALSGSIEDMLTGMVKNVLNAGTCAVQQMVGAITNKITETIDSLVSPLTNGVSGLLEKFGVKAFNVKSFINKGLNIMGKAKDLFSCGGKTSKPVDTDKFVIDKLDAKPMGSNEQQNFMDKAFESANQVAGQIEKGKNNILKGLPSGLNKFEEAYGKFSIFGSKVSEAGDTVGTDCYTGNIFKCGSPKVEIFGGNGIGGAGKVLFGNFIDKLDPDDIFGDVKRTASIVGVEITDTGEGYSEEPLVTFTDSCDQGVGAFGKAIVDKNINSPTFGQITNIVVLSEGENYPVDIPGEVDEVYIEKIIIENPGAGYENATISDECINLNVVDGKCVSCDIVCQKPYTTLPEIEELIENPGYGAIFRVIMTLNKPIVPDQTLEVVDCVGDFPTGGDN